MSERKGLVKELEACQAESYDNAYPLLGELIEQSKKDMEDLRLCFYMWLEFDECVGVTGDSVKDSVTYAQALERLRAMLGESAQNTEKADETGENHDQ